MTGFEPATFWSRTKRATKLRYTPKKWSQCGDSDPRPADYESAALPTELHWQLALFNYRQPPRTCQDIYYRKLNGNFTQETAAGKRIPAAQSSRVRSADLLFKLFFFKHGVRNLADERLGQLAAEFDIVRHGVFRNVLAAVLQNFFFERGCR